MASIEQRIFNDVHEYSIRAGRMLKPNTIYVGREEYVEIQKTCLGSLNLRMDGVWYHDLRLYVLNADHHLAVCFTL